MKQDVIMERYTKDLCPICKKAISSDREKDPVTFAMYKGVQVMICAHHPC